MTKSFKIILNPTAGHGNGAKALPKIEKLFTQQGVSFNLVRTEHPGHGIELTRQAVKEGYAVIVAAGGDGTVNEVINGLMESKLEGLPIPPMGVLCVGRGNDFAGSMGIPTELEAGFQALVAGNRRTIDVGRVVGGKFPQGRYLGNCVGVGFDAITTIEVAKMPRWGGYLSFLLAVFKTVFLYNKAPLAKIEFDGSVVTQRSLLISIMNGRRLGGGFIMAPNSVPDDGAFDLCIAEQMSSFEVIKMIPHFTRGNQATQPSIKTGRAAKIRPMERSSAWMAPTWILKSFHARSRSSTRLRRLECEPIKKDHRWYAKRPHQPDLPYRRCPARNGPKPRPADPVHQSRKYPGNSHHLYSSAAAARAWHDIR
jgi:diacylglycerol kinase (ATP)